MCNKLKPNKYFVVSDVHSYMTELMKALNEKGFEKDNSNHILCVCGDLFDRGDETVKLFEFIKELNAQDRLIYIRGNHEDLLFDCVKEIRRGDLPGYHHFRNGTVKTICQFCGQCEWIVYDPTWTDTIYATMRPILDFIDENCVDYYEIGDYILTHAWLPTYIHLDDFRDADEFDWKSARWCSPIDMWSNPECRIDGKTVVVGHWHTSAAHSKLHNNGSEWGEDACFDHFYDDGIIMIDACTARSGKINVLVIE